MITITRKLPKRAWRPYFDFLSRHLQTTKVTVVIEGLDLGVQPEVEGLVLVGITYDDADDDIIEIVCEMMVHRVVGPRDIYVQEDVNGALLSLKVTDADGHNQIAQFDPVLMLPESVAIFVAGARQSATNDQLSG